MVKVILDEKDLKELHELKEKFRVLVFEIGSTEIDIKILESELESVKEKKDELFEKYVQLNEIEENLVERLFNKYGRGSINLEEGVIILEQ